MGKKKRFRNGLSMRRLSVFGDVGRLLTREEFKFRVFEMTDGKCCLCSAAAVDAHHIMDRKLFPDGGYRLSNGAPVCESCHWKCETGEVSVMEVLSACGLESPLLPDGMDGSKIYDKWGNEVMPDGRRCPGPLFGDAGVAKMLKGVEFT